MYKVQNAIIVAAGKGERMLPLTSDTPKPLIKVFGKPIIENTIEILLGKGISDIYIVVGYLSEQFYYLENKYGVKIVVNPDYDTCNNISSLYYAREYLCNSLIMDADIWIKEQDVILTHFSASGYTSVWTEKNCNEWIQRVDENDYVVSCERSGNLGWILYSISYWNEEDCEKLKKYIYEEFKVNRNRQIYWDDVPIFCHAQAFHLQIKRTKNDAFLEFDSIKELADYDKSYMQIM